MKTTYDERKFTELVLHIASCLQSDSAGGATKLNNVLFFAEFAHVRRTGRPIAGPPTRSWSTAPLRDGSSR